MHYKYVFANFTYVDTEHNEAGQPEMIITRLNNFDFPFIRYKMRDIADVEFRVYPDGTEKYLITKIEGKDSNFILNDQGSRFYPSFFNTLVNDLNLIVSDSVIEIKVFEKGQRELEVQFILSDNQFMEQVRTESKRLLSERLSSEMDFVIRFVDFIDHDYRRKYRVIQRIGDKDHATRRDGEETKRRERFTHSRLGPLTRASGRATRCTGAGCSGWRTATCSTASGSTACATAPAASFRASAT